MLSWILEKAFYACPEVFGAGAVKALALRRVEDGPLCLMAPPLGFHRFTVFIWKVLSAALCMPCWAHTFLLIPCRDIPPTCSGEADTSQLKTPLTLSLPNSDCGASASLFLEP